MSLTPETYELILKIVDERVKEIKVTREDFDKLSKTVNQLAENINILTQRINSLTEAHQKLVEAQKATEEELKKLAEAQKATEERLNKLTERVDKLAERVNELAEAQKATEERLNKLTERVDQLALRVNELAEAQKATEERLNKLTERVDKLAESVRELGVKFDELSMAVGRLSDVIGFGLEDIARVVVPGWLERHLGIYVEDLVRQFFYVEGMRFEVNLYGEGVKENVKTIIIGECRSRIYGRDVKEFLEKYSLIRKVLPSNVNVVGLMFGYLIHPSAQEVAERNKIYVIASYMR